MAKVCSDGRGFVDRSMFPLWELVLRTKAQPSRGHLCDFFMAQLSKMTLFPHKKAPYLSKSTRINITAMLISSWQLSPSPCLVPSSLLLSTAFKKKFAVMTHAYKIKMQPLKGKTSLGETTPQQTFPATCGADCEIEETHTMISLGSFIYLSISVHVCTYIYIYLYVYICQAGLYHP